MRYKQLIKKITDYFKKDKTMSIEQITSEEFSERRLGTIHFRKVSGMIFGLKEEKYDKSKENFSDSLKSRDMQKYASLLRSIAEQDYKQIFIIRTNLEGTILVSIEDENHINKFSSDLLYIANKHGWKFIEKRPADIEFPIEPRGSNIVYCPSPSILETYRREIDEVYKTTALK